MLWAVWASGANGLVVAIGAVASLLLLCGHIAVLFFERMVGGVAAGWQLSGVLSLRRFTGLLFVLLNSSGEDGDVVAACCASLRPAGVADVLKELRRLLLLVTARGRRGDGGEPFASSSLSSIRTTKLGWPAAFPVESGLATCVMWGGMPVALPTGFVREEDTVVAVGFPPGPGATGEWVVMRSELFGKGE